jgi:hypothetical protein
LVGHAGAGETQVDGQLSHANPPWVMTAGTPS